MRIAEHILDILADCTTEGNVVYLPAELDRATYLAVNKCLTNIGGEWNRKAKGHVFDYDPAEALDNLVITGETEDMKKKFQFFPTPRPVAEIMCGMAELDTDSVVLEPSCGKGDLMDVIAEFPHKELYGVELNLEMLQYIVDKKLRANIGKDFLEYNKNDYYNRIIMNPPFSRQQDIDHIYKAYDVLQEDGVLVSVLSPAWNWRTNTKSVQFREWLAEVGAEVLDLPEGAFKESGTMMKTQIIKIEKREGELS